MYNPAISVVIFSTSFWPLTSILVMPGRSMMVRSGQSLEYILSLMGSLTICPPFPATSSVTFSMFVLTSMKFVYFLAVGSFSKIAYGFPSVFPSWYGIYLGRYGRVWVLKVFWWLLLILSARNPVPQCSTEGNFSHSIVSPKLLFLATKFPYPARSLAPHRWCLSVYGCPWTCPSSWNQSSCSFADYI